MGPHAIQAVARIMGASSGAARALKDAAAHDGPVRFWFSPGQKKWIVEKLTKKGDGEP
jgi:hypothetical protein